MPKILSDNNSRLLSLDAFRGATIAGMLLVNNPGDWGNIYRQLEHAPWSGWTFTDLIFPFFLWIVGVSMTFSIAKRIERGETKSTLLLHAIRRSVILFALGMFLGGYPFGLLFGHQFSFATWRIPGVLQRIAVCYLIATVCYLYLSLRLQALVTIALLAGYWLLMALVNVPGFGTGIYAPVGNLCWYIDSHLLAGHTWIYAPTPGFDPEGFLSTIPAIVTTLFGIFAGKFLRSDRSQEEKTIGLFVAGNTFLLAGSIMDHWLPINKNMWTSSYAVFMAGMAMIVFAFCYWLIDVKGYRKGTAFFTIFGVNAIGIYFCSEFLGKLIELINWKSGGETVTLKGFVYHSFFEPLLAPRNSSFLFAICWVLVMFLFTYILHRKRIIIKV
ncbi:MAG TPA: heparan-alpha-glucosaminide N-acetyltransferase domain-containing protein [Bacteroidota bacterium]|nr:heparan-alpha-glucosaminide N-acetyltransferase domain-containing protein [Bacteroidota bacterium]